MNIQILMQKHTLPLAMEEYTHIANITFLLIRHIFQCVCFNLLRRQGSKEPYQCEHFILF